MRGLVLLAAMLALAPSADAQSSDAGVDLVLSGVMTRADHRAYREFEFEAPDGVRAITVSLDYERGEPWAAIDIALYDPERFRGASGFAKISVFIGEQSATPSYLPGPLPAGRWRLVLGGANAPEHRDTPFRVRVHFDRHENAGAAPFSRVLIDQPGWYRGDLHTHSGHSDGVCATMSGERAPCPIYRTLQAARAQGLDFIAVTDHNTVSHIAELSALQAEFDRIAIIPAQEVTTYHGHMNVFGATAPVDFRLGADTGLSLADVSAQVDRLGGVLSINHPGISLSEGCPGCGWSVPLTPDAHIDAVEVVNGVIARWGGGVEGPASSIPFWIARLNAGERLTAIGGSDNHDPAIAASELSAVGRPATVVFAENLSSPAILEGLREGHAFIDIEGAADRQLILRARFGIEDALMGDTVTPRRNDRLEFEVTASGLPEGARIEIWRDGAPWRQANTLSPGAVDLRFDWRADGRAHWFNSVARDGQGQLILLANAIYIDPVR